MASAVPLRLAACGFFPVRARILKQLVGGIRSDGVDQFELLKTLSRDTNLMWQDRAMAVKSIGDLDTPEGRAFLGELRTQLKASTEKESQWTLELIALYI